ncbi:hypothetical protein BDN70DRAFT_964836 [Pholiota conissans]|uniref:Aldos-2-ulose dehydratase/isomerase (AUDH) Cupin domain-containing protein n=1 Tax=Pholiota conissans TaxID=109636 RepID=A0A9P5YRS8_9AGAR|nr:hypothetical protein BDN70DRAFT_964836 [Pholiota conissans]
MSSGGAPLCIEENLVAAPLPDGYWLNNFPFSTTTEKPDLIGYGLGYEGKPASLKLFENPKNTGASGWKVTEIQSLEYPVGMTYADLTGDGYNDIIIIDRYGPSMSNLWDADRDNGGRIQWLRNPGQRSDALPFWTATHIGNSTGMHSITVGHFTRQDVWQVMGFPIIPASNDLTSPAPIILYTPRYDSSMANGPVAWDNQVIFPSQFRLVHDVRLVQHEGYDMVVIAGREGIATLWFDPTGEIWHHAIIGEGLPRDIASGNPYWGSGSVDICKTGSDTAGYIATCEGFHGNIVSVYEKSSEAPNGPESLKSGSFWRRRVIDSYGPLSKEHTGTIHNVASISTGADIEPFGIACMGAPIGIPNNQGVYMYTPTDISAGKFERTKISKESASRLADIASITYYVPNYHTGPDPPNVRINILHDFPPVTAQRLQGEVLIRLPRPSVVPIGMTPSLSMISFAGKRLSLIVIPPNASVRLGSADAFKVIYGSVRMASNGTDIIRRIAPPSKVAETTAVLSSNGMVTATENGAIVLRVEIVHGELQGPFHIMSDVVIANVFPNDTNVESAVRQMSFPFLKVDTLPWASNGLFDDFEFYNMSGFHLYFNDDSMEEICHMQAWTLGVGETSFCEIHYCLSNGAGQGGMRYFPDSYPQTDEAESHIQANELNKAFVEENSTLLVVPSMFEHGPLWMVQDGTEATPKIRPNATVDYPWHAWLSSGFGEFEIPISPPLPESEQAYDVWLAFEFPPSAFQF